MCVYRSNTHPQLFSTIIGIAVTSLIMMTSACSTNSSISSEAAMQSDPIKRYTSIESMQQEVPGFTNAFETLEVDIGHWFEEQFGQVLEKPFSSAYSIDVLHSDKGNAFDLNQDGLPELMLSSHLFCGTGGCTTDIYTFNQETEAFEVIGNVSTRNLEPTGQTINDWLALKATWKNGMCSRTEFEYVYQNGEYVISQQNDVELCN
ncbi:hypothetical protein [Vibrio maerlii]|uniref:hypothetical protein n=1 Tax=Vibrio maerlii TaxID=2231648 RepID=UPI000E3C4734|nr:hypothetical protein [Vibrio maerlii]